MMSCQFSSVWLDISYSDKPTNHHHHHNKSKTRRSSSCSISTHSYISVAGYQSFFFHIGRHRATTTTTTTAANPLQSSNQPSLHLEISSIHIPNQTPLSRSNKRTQH